MAQINFYVDDDLKEFAEKAFNTIGITMTDALILFLKQCAICEGLPFNSEITKYKPEVIDTMLDAKKVSQDPNIKAYDSFSDAVLDIEEDLSFATEVNNNDE